MTELQIFLLCLPVALLLTWRLLTGPVRQHRDERRSAESVRGGERFARSHNIGLRHAEYERRRFKVCASPCRAALERRDAVYLSIDAPVLPLNECNRPGDCRCRYALQDDRRSGRDRRYPAEYIQAGNDVLNPDAVIATRDRRARNDRRRSRRTGPYAGIY